MSHTYIEREGKEIGRRSSQVGGGFMVRSQYWSGGRVGDGMALHRMSLSCCVYDDRIAFPFYNIFAFLLMPLFSRSLSLVAFFLGSGAGFLGLCEHYLPCCWAAPSLPPFPKVDGTRKRG